MATTDWLDDEDVEMTELDVYFRDLPRYLQREVLRLYRIKEPGEMNWDVLPITSIIVPAEKDELDED